MTEHRAVTQNRTVTQSRSVIWKSVCLKAFTLVELLVVMAIMVLLGTMIMSFVNIGGLTKDQQATKALIQTVGTAIDLFRNETGAIPLPTGSATDPQSGSWYPSENDGSWEKQQLWWRLNHAMTQAEKDEMRAKGEAVNLALNPFQSIEYMKQIYPNHTVRATKIQEIMNTVPNADADVYKGWYVGSEWLYNSAPYIDVNGGGSHLSHRGSYKRHILEIKALVARDLEQRKYTTFPCLLLEDVVDETFIQGQTIVDAWGQPLIYIGHSTVSVLGRGVYRSGQLPIEHRAVGRALLTDRNADGGITDSDWDVAPDATDDGKKRDWNNDGSPDLNPYYVDWNKDGGIDKDDWSSLLWNALPGQTLDFYLASAGPDLMFNCLKNNPDNADNIEFGLIKVE